MKTKQFFRGFFASLILRNVSEIDTRDGDHYKRFTTVLLEVEKDELPLYVPNPVTGQILELDASLIYLRKECTEIVPPYECVRLTYTKEEARKVVQEFNLQDRTLITNAAKIFIGAT